MYHQSLEIVKCSHCGAVNNTEIVIRGNEKILRCVSCKHERVIATFTGYFQNTETTIYISKPPKETLF